MIARDSGEQARAQVAEAAAGKPPVLLIADLSVQADIRRVARQVQDQYDHVDILINNAGAAFSRREQSADGFELTWATNQLGPFLLTELLLPLLQAAPAGRIVNVVSEFYSRKLDLDNLQGQQRYSYFGAYSAYRSPVPRTARGHRAWPTRSTARRFPPPQAFPQLSRHLRRYLRRPGDARIRPTHSPRDRADGFRNLSFCTQKPVTQSGVTGSDPQVVAGVGFEPTWAEPKGFTVRSCLHLLMPTDLWKRHFTRLTAATLSAYLHPPVTASLLWVTALRVQE